MVGQCLHNRACFLREYSIMIFARVCLSGQTNTGILYAMLLCTVNAFEGGLPMKRFVALMLTLLMLFTTAYAEIDLSGMSHEELSALRDQIDELLGSDQNTGTANTTDTPHMPVAIKASPDKYTWYIQDYVGRNAAGFGYTSLGGDRLERYGAGYVQFIFMTEKRRVSRFRR